MRTDLRISVIFISAIVSAAAIAAVTADEMPPRKPGGWEIVVTGEKINDARMKLCIDTDTDKLFNKIGTGLAEQKCARKDVKTVANVTTIDSQCKIGNSTVTGTTMMTFTGDTAFHAEIKNHVEPALFGKTDSVTTQDGKWTGPCEGGMKPGDFTAGNGMKINVKMRESLRKFMPAN